MSIIANLTEMLHHEFTSNNFFSGAVVGGVLLGIYHTCRSYPKRFFDWVMLRFFVIIYFDSTDMVYDCIQLWLHNEVKFDRFKRHYRIISQKKHHALGGARPFNVEDDSDDSEEANEWEFLFTPFNGNYVFKYHGKWIKIEFDREDKNGEGNSNNNFGRPLDKLTIKYLGRDTTYAKKFLKEITATYEARAHHTVSVFLPGSNGNYWFNHGILVHRDKDSLMLKDKSIDMLLTDIAHFKDKKTEEWYIKVGVPYHRGYLFYGPPGTGKSSAAAILASAFDANIYSMSVSKTMTDSDFISLVTSVASRSFLVIEDVDCLFDKNRQTLNEGRLSFNTVLNTLDGFCSKHGSMVILTTNYADRLDPALLRPGRIDVKVKFDLFDAEQLKGMFLKFFPEHPDLAQQFSAAIPVGKYSGAQIQEYLMRHFDSPNKALTDAPNIDTILAEVSL